ncbi:DUF5133 domain-containing protein [Streptomyces sp. NPDC059506]|uniref:DUF5133 domain-containing protein n=1 Tax=Streptomyces TaxID=1883 RepID=UPI0015F79EC6|nr:MULTISPECIES: DUF5133 domain-containing protein [unclassified Streptomyces]MCZ2526380.1 DUF5133 domain-containing protein [Streptomyces sp. HB2AG]QMV24527.1 DUF5133 domain-containing protein [Streptomyces sp. SCUT-3]
MLTPHPLVLKQLLARWEAVANATATTPQALREREDTAYTLCVATGTRDVESALAAARKHLAAAPELAGATADRPGAPAVRRSPAA